MLGWGPSGRRDEGLELASSAVAFILVGSREPTAARPTGFADGGVAFVLTRDGLGGPQAGRGVRVGEVGVPR